MDNSSDGTDDARPAGTSSTAVAAEKKQKPDPTGSRYDSAMEADELALQQTDEIKVISDAVLQWTSAGESADSELQIPDAVDVLGSIINESEVASVDVSNSPEDHARSVEAERWDNKLRRSGSPGELAPSVRDIEAPIVEVEAVALSVDQEPSAQEEFTVFNNMAETEPPKEDDRVQQIQREQDEEVRQQRRKEELEKEGGRKKNFKLALVVVFLTFVAVGLGLGLGFGLPKKDATSKQGIGAKCGGNSDCMSNWCTDGMCRACFINKDELHAAIRDYTGGSSTNEISAFYGNSIGKWCVRDVHDMSFLFKDETSFNQDIGGWDVSSVTSMYHMFNGATSFKQNLCPWKEHIRSTVFTTDMFAYTDCPVTADPSPPWNALCFSCSSK